MVLSYYGLRESPFGVTPDPRYLFASATHREALASILYGIDAGVGFIALTAMPGMGKTTLLFEALGTIKRKAMTAFLFQTITTPADLLKALLADLGVVKPEGGMMELQALLNDLLAGYSAEGKRIVVVIDEAQNLDDGVLEMVRMLSNFESSREKFMQIVLSGQPQLAKRLAEPQLLQLRQRISISARLAPLSAADVAAYIEHRLAVAGYRAEKPLFTPPAVELIARHSGGIPRNINNLCFNALSIGCAVKASRIGPEIIREVISDLDLDPIAGAAAIPPPNPPPNPQPETLRAGSSQPAKRRWFTGAWAGSNRRGFQAGAIAMAAALVISLAFGLWTLTHKDATASAAARASNAGAAPAAAAAAAGSSGIALSGAAREGRDRSLSPPAAVAGRNGGPNAGPDAGPDGVKGRWVTAVHGQTLRRICVENFGICEPSLFQAILQANPAIRNPHRIKAGQRILLPELPDSASRLKEMHARLNGGNGQAQDTQ
jgi:general secretion pathway protein A